MSQEESPPPPLLTLRQLHGAAASWRLPFVPFRSPRIVLRGVSAPLPMLAQPQFHAVGVQPSLLQAALAARRLPFLQVAVSLPPRRVLLRPEPIVEQLQLHSLPAGSVRRGYFGE